MKVNFDGSSDSRFRSQLEQRTADELDRHSVAWRYEVRVTLPDGQPVYYLPDFTIDGAPDVLQLPEWIECKPQQMLYDLRDLLGVTRRAGEYFQDDVTVEGADADALRQHGVDELWKPKMLAERTGGSVLVIGGVSGNNKLSITMKPDSIVMSRTQPFVNWPGHRRRIERDERQAQWAQHEAEAQARAAAARQAQANERRGHVRQILAAYKPINPRFASRCFGCDRHSDDGGVYRVTFQDGHERWVRICVGCQAGV